MPEKFPEMTMLEKLDLLLHRQMIEHHYSYARDRDLRLRLALLQSEISGLRDQIAELKRQRGKIDIRVAKKQNAEGGPDDAHD